jgi:hypothetical protein
MSHKTKLTSLKEAEVDLQMIPLVKYLNTFPGVYTLHSCQGQYFDETVIQRPYIVFIFESQYRFSEMVGKLLELIEDNWLDFKINNSGGLLRYSWGLEPYQLELANKKLEKKYGWIHPRAKLKELEP